MTFHDFQTSRTIGIPRSRSAAENHHLAPHPLARQGFRGAAGHSGGARVRRYRPVGSLYSRADKERVSAIMYDIHAAKKGESARER